MYLSQLLFKRMKTETGDISNPYNLHKAIWKTFPCKDEQPRDFLFRAECRNDNILVLMLSASGPVETNDIELKTKKIEVDFKEGEKYIFSLRANPIKRLLKERRRVPLVQEDVLNEWLKRKFEGAAQVIESMPLACRDIDFYKGDKWGKLRVVDFQGVIKCENPMNLRGLFTGGIGPAKAFGCGMLLLKKYD